MNFAHQCLKASLTGRFRIENEAGKDFTPRGSKSQGLLALLLAESQFGRTRAWLQDKLWSDRGQEQGAASLRQALAEIKRSFGDYAEILQANRKTVSLDRARVTLTSDGDGEFLEGIDVRDPEFEQWLTIERSRRQSQMSVPLFDPPGILSLSSATYPSIPVVIMLDGSSNPRLQIIEHLFIDYVSRTLRENLGSTVVLQEPSLIQPGTLVISMRTFDTNDESFALKISVDDYQRRGILWSAVRSHVSMARATDANSDIISLACQLCEAVGDAMTGHILNVPFDRDANLLANIAVRKLFTIDKVDLEAADQLLQQAYDIEPRGIYQAWRAKLTTIQFVERYDTDLQALREKSDECCARALAADRTNSTILAAVADTRIILDQDYSSGGELALIGIRSNRSNPFAWSALSIAYLHSGDYEAAYKASVQAQRLAEGTRVKFWGDFHRSLTAAIIGRSGEALKLGISSNALAPNFRPTLRYLAVFQAAAGDIESARRSIRKLMKYEPSFTVDQLIRDKEYPAKLLHKTGLLDRVDLLALT